MFFIFISFLCIVCVNSESNKRLDCFLESMYSSALKTCDHRSDLLLDDFQINEQNCRSRGCLWDSKIDGIPWCYLDTTQVGYKVTSVQSSDSGLEADLVVKDTAKKVLKSEEPIGKLKLKVMYLTDKILRFKIFDPKVNRYEVPIQKDFPILKNSLEEKEEKNRKYSLEFSKTGEDFLLAIRRKDSKSRVFDTSIGGLMFSEQLLQIASLLDTKDVFGFGENVHQSLKHDLNYKTWPLFPLDQPPGDHDKNLYGVHPFYHVLEENGKSHGILFLNSNAMEYTLLPEPAVVLKTTGGILDFFIFLGDTPEEVIQLYVSSIGKPILPPFWSLGFQLTRYGFKDGQEVQQYIDRNTVANIPLDVMYIDIDYMDRFRDFTYDQNKFGNLPKMVTDSRQQHGIHWAFILDPAIEADDTKYQIFGDGYKDDVFIKWDQSVQLSDRHNPANVPTDKDVLYGKVWPAGPAAFPDFFKNKTVDWWIRWGKSLHTNVSFDGLWIDMNEPSNFESKCPQNKYDYPKIRSKAVYGTDGSGQLSHKTVCMLSRQGEDGQYLHYDVHSLYGFTETVATNKALQEITGKRGFVLSRSTFVSSGRYTGHWLGDNTSQWSHLRTSIIGVLEFNFFGISFVGADICGFMGDSEPELCRRWSALGAFYPFCRNHNNINSIAQDPAIWAQRGHPEVTETAKISLQLRAHLTGETVARPLFHNYPEDPKTTAIDQQFMWGKDLLISPFIFQNQKEVKAYLPSRDSWFTIYPIISKVEIVGDVTIADTPTGPPPLHVRGGAIIPMTNERNLTNTGNKGFKDINLVIFPSKTGVASGQLFWDDHESVGTVELGKYNLYDFQLNSNCSLDITLTKNGFLEFPKIVAMTVANTKEGVIKAEMDGKSVKGEWKDGLTIIELNVEIEKSTRILWTGNGNNCNLI